MANSYQETSHYTIFILFLTLFLLLQPTLATSNQRCTCDDKSQLRNQNNTSSNGVLKFKIIAIVSILISSATGVCLPFMATNNIPALHPEKNIYFLIKAFAAGVILATGFIHVLPDAFESLTSPCIVTNPWGTFPFTGFVAMMSAIGTLVMESCATGYHRRSELRKARPVDGDEIQNATSISDDQHVILRVSDPSDSSELIRHRIISQVLELGIVVHSVIIGISLGASESSHTIKPLVAALSFHQFFEGMGLGACISQAKFKARAITIMVLFFSLTTPIGIGVGIGISKIYAENSPTALVVQGLLNSASAGILIYMALVDLLAADFMKPQMQTNVRLQLGANFALLFGATCMSLLAKWGGM